VFDRYLSSQSPKGIIARNQKAKNKNKKKIKQCNYAIHLVDSLMLQNKPLWIFSQNILTFGIWMPAFGAIVSTFTGATKLIGSQAKET